MSHELDHHRVQPVVDEAPRWEHAGKRARTDHLVQRKASPPASAAAPEPSAAPTASGDDPFGFHLPTASGGGAPLPEAQRSKFEASLGADLSAVRVHTDGASTAAAERLDAHAYTVGHDIHFGDGQYDPASARGEHLLAHEVAHTVQQGGSAGQQGGSAGAPQFELAVSQPGDAAEVEADRAADAMVAGTPGVQLSRVAPALHRAVRTSGGTFETPEYAAKRPPAWGALFTLAFTPNSTVEAEHIALVQTARSTTGGPGHETPLIRTSGQGATTDPLLTVNDPASPGHGTRIDSPGGTNSPVYGSERGATGLGDLHAEPMGRVDRHERDVPVGTLREGSVPSLTGGHAQEGFRRVSGGRAEVQQAVLTDAPGGYSSGRYDGVIRDGHFETAALAVDGRQPGRWLGAVAWGYHVDATGRSTLQPRAITRVSDGDPSAAFAAAANQWNQATLPGGEPTIDLPAITPAPARP